MTTISKLGNAFSSYFYRTPILVHSTATSRVLTKSKIQNCTPQELHCAGFCYFVNHAPCKFYRTPSFSLHSSNADVSGGDSSRDREEGDLQHREVERHPDAEKDPLPEWPGGVNPETGERGGPRGPEPTRYGDWERKGRVSDF